MIATILRSHIKETCLTTVTWIGPRHRSGMRRQHPYHAHRKALKMAADANGDGSQSSEDTANDNQPQDAS